ncbi:hypothetical protein FKM82_024808, partial [Ascaphus truei]
MASRESGTALSRRNYRLTSESEKTKVTGIVNEKLLSQFLQRIFPGTESAQHGATYRKPLTFQNLEERLERLLSAGDNAEENTGEGVGTRFLSSLSLCRMMQAEGNR